MAWFSKVKSSASPAPMRCARCGKRPATVLIRVVYEAEVRPFHAAPRALWHCDACQDETGRDAADDQ